MTIAEYAKSRGVSKQSVYERIKRGTLQYEVIDGVKHIIEAPESKGLIETPVSTPVSKRCKKLEKTLKKLNRVKHELELAYKDVEHLHTLISAKDSELDSLRNTLGLLDTAISRNLLSAPVDDVIEVPVTKKKKKRKGKK